MEYYRLEEAAEVLQVGLSTLREWIDVTGLRKTVQQQRLDYDLRRHYLTGDQLNALATAHGRTLKPYDQIRRLENLEAINTALQQQIQALETRVKTLEKALDALKGQA